MDNIVIEISTGNSAFDDNLKPEIARILRKLADDLEEGAEPMRLRDYNGNTVGSVSYVRSSTQEASANE